MNKGFTLIEVLVSSALFFIIVSAGLVAFSTFLKFYELAHKKRISLYSISFAVEENITQEAWTKGRGSGDLNRNPPV